ncbi:hypothetical protein [Bifidobacterium magnum]|uniref:Uncharacterized protein n=1 Tax=Bifidobacterium magnum TaxID=1692 RepID=A0A087B694_9BIFI|nr:hypothetical protein [Bifidobacterium magnum]KFI66544.1 hypothetical protein BMAGN_1452 [Bifidobacterium magnum]
MTENIENVENVENTGGEFPATLEELIEKTPVLEGFPMMVVPGKLKPKQSADFLVLETVVEDTLAKLDIEKEPVQQAIRMGYVVEVADEFFTKIVKDKKAYERWAEGKPAADLAAAYLTLCAFYKIELGKSALSSTRTGNAE